MRYFNLNSRGVVYVKSIKILHAMDGDGLQARLVEPFLHSVDEIEESAARRGHRGAFRPPVKVELPHHSRRLLRL
jgi:hypothetical protein